MVTRVFIGFDSRQPIAFSVLSHSILRHASVPVSITPLILDTLPITRKGLTDFTFARYLVPWLCDYEGFGIFMDSDMLVTADVDDIGDPVGSVAYVPHGPDVAYENTSVMVFNNPLCTKLTPEYIENDEPQTLKWAEQTNSLPDDWNHLVGYETSTRIPRLIHYTQGIPEYKECRDCDYADLWFAEKEAMLHSVSWIEIMGQSVHANPVLSRLLA